MRANLVERSQDWEWSSLKPTELSGPEGLLAEGPVAKPAQWTRMVNGAETEAELKSLLSCIERGTPFGDADWQVATAQELGLESSLRPRGRPRLDLDGDRNVASRDQKDESEEKYESRQ